MGKLTELRDELMQNPEFRAGYEQQAQLVRFGQMMRAARENQDLTQTQLADRLGIGQSEVSRLEKGEGVNGPTFERIVAFAHALGLKLVVGFSEEPDVSDAPSTESSGPRMLRMRRRRAFRRARGQGEGQPAAVMADESETLWSAF